MMNSKHGGSYDDGQVDLHTVVEPPSYQACLDWMAELPDSRSAAFDCWARGNFVRRLLFNRNRGTQSLFVQAATPDEMKWIYRRLALVGVPLDIVYTGALSKPQWTKVYQPLDIMIDHGWGYICFAGTILRSPSGRRWWPLLGYASLMPEEIVDWLRYEAERPFSSGRLFISPAELIGLNRTPRVQHMKGLADLTDGGAVVESVDTAIASLELEIPSIDGMPGTDFENLLSDHRDELEEFQTAFRHLVSGYHRSEEDTKNARNRVASAVDEMMRSGRYAAFRATISKSKGSLSTFPGVMGILAAVGAAYSADPFAGAAVLAGAGKVLRDLWAQSRAEERASSQNPYRVLLRLGVEKARFKRVAPTSYGNQSQRKKSSKLGPYHWLCPPSCGIRAAGMLEAGAASK